jgi:acetyltransferase-like isoleucine patch superfamily enzyme
MPKPEIWQEDPLRLLGRITHQVYGAWVRATYPFAAIGRDVDIDPSWDFRRYLAHRLSLGSGVQIWKDVHFGISSPDRMTKGDPVIILDDNVTISRHVQISARNRVHIERDVIISAGSLIMDHNHAFEDPDLPISGQGITEGGTIRIGEGSFIGHGASIVCNRGELNLGRNCVVAANSLVTQSVPSHSVVMGIPARIIRQYDPLKRQWVMGGARTTDIVLPIERTHRGEVA